MLKDKFDLTDKVVLIIGGRGYLGRYFSLAVKEFGANVYSADLPESSPAVARDSSRPLLEGIHQRDVDVTSRESMNELIEGVLAETSHIDVLVYTATVKPPDFYTPFTECSLEGWQNVIRVEMDGLFLAAQRVGRAMESAGRGNIIFLSSIYGVVGNDQRIYEGSNLSTLYGSGGESNRRIYSHAVYPAVKGAVISLTRYLAAYWEGKNIRVNCISPGGVSHPEENDAFVEKYSSRVPLGRKAEIEEISSAVVYLASDASSYVNGHNLIVDGGWTAW